VTTTTDNPYATMMNARAAFEVARNAMWEARRAYHDALDAYTLVCIETGGGEMAKCYYCDGTLNVLWIQICCGQLSCRDCQGNDNHACEERTP